YAIDQRLQQKAQKPRAHAGHLFHGVQLLPHPSDVPGYPSWNSLVPFLKEHSVSILENSTPVRENRQFSGPFKIQYSQAPLLSPHHQATQMTNATGTLLVFPPNNQRGYLKHSVFNPTMWKYASEKNQNDLTLQTSLPLDWSA